MCGINGIFAYGRGAAPVDVEELVRTREAMAKRGPDASSVWVAPTRDVAFGHLRLAIIDLSETGAQPMTSSDGRYTITFNGEIYNYRALRDELAARGAVFRGHSDTEVLLHLYAQKREAMLDDLRGMFAFAIWDSVEGSLFLARDPFGIKPLYYSDCGRTFRFASQVKALLASGAVDREPDPAGLAGFYLWGSVPEPFTSYKAVKALPAGAFMTVNARGATEPTRYYSLAAVYANAEASPKALKDFEAAAREALLDSVRHHLIADVPVGAFLSAGIDSGALVGLMRDAGQENIQTVTLSFEEFRGTPNDEAPLAAEVARRYGTQHHERVVSEAEFRSDLPYILKAMDQPTIDGINTWFVSKAASELGLKVVISGLGGDELFGGYRSFVNVPRWVSQLRRVPRAKASAGTARRLASLIGLERFGLNPKLSGFLEFGGSFPGAYFLQRGLFMPWDLKQLLEPDILADAFERLHPITLVEDALTPCPSSAFAKVATLESALYMRNQLLRDCDWSSMAHSIEVRVPLVDAWLTKSLAPYLISPDFTPGKTALARAPLKPLPDKVVHRPKTGFTTPIAAWLQRTALLRARGPVPTVAKKRSPWARQWAYTIGRRAAA